MTINKLSCTRSKTKMKQKQYSETTFVSRMVQDNYLYNRHLLHILFHF